MKEFTVCYTLDNDIKRGKLVKELNVKAEDVLQEILENMERNKYFVITSNEGSYTINAALVRYIRIVDEKELIVCS